MRGLVLGVLVDMCDNPKVRSILLVIHPIRYTCKLHVNWQAIPHVSAWRGKSQPNAWSLLVQLWRQEEADLEVPRDVMNTVAGTARVCVCFSALQLMLSLMFCCTVFRHNPATRWSRPESSGDASTAVKPAIAINNGCFWEHESKDLCTLHQAGLPVSFRQPHHRGQDYHVHHTELPGL